MSDTPLTDAVECEIFPSADPNYDGPSRWVEAAFARSLEKRLTSAHATLLEDNQRLKRELEEATAARDMALGIATVNKREAEAQHARAQASEASCAELIERCAKACEKRAELRFEEHGYTEPDTNASYYVGEWRDLGDSLDEEDADCAAAIRALTPHPVDTEREEERKDAERYRWLRERPSYIGWDWWETSVPKETIITPEFMDAAIDALLAPPSVSAQAQSAKEKGNG